MNAPLKPGTAAVAAESRFAIPGMHCSGCIAKIEKGLNAQAGVHAARVNFTSKQVSIAHDEAQKAYGKKAMADSEGKIINHDCAIRVSRRTYTPTQLTAR